MREVSPDVCLAETLLLQLHPARMSHHKSCSPVQASSDFESILDKLLVDLDRCCLCLLSLQHKIQ